jgi:hypothetical protein
MIVLLIPENLKYLKIFLKLGKIKKYNYDRKENLSIFWWEQISIPKVFDADYVRFFSVMSQY